MIATAFLRILQKSWLDTDRTDVSKEFLETLRNNFAPTPIASPTEFGSFAELELNLN